MTAEGLEVEIARLGSGGDGVAEGPSGPIYVPFTLPGERVVITLKPGEDRGALLDVLSPSPNRVAPVCSYFGDCGGCSLQHMEAGAYLAWKREQVAAALKSRGLTAEIEPVRPVPLASRRRATLSLGRGRDGPVLGFRRSRSHDLIDVAACPVLTPAISDRLSMLKTGLVAFLGGKREARVTVTETLGGLDLLVEGVRPSPTAIGAFASRAGGLGAARLTAGGESIALGGVPEVDLSGIDVKLPPGAFLQASREAEGEMVALVREGVGGAKRIADLFAGLGTFALALARSAAVDAYEADEAAVAALAGAARKTPGLKPVRTLIRDSSAHRSSPRSWRPMTRSSSTLRAQAHRHKPHNSPSRSCPRWSLCPATPARLATTFASWSMAAISLRVLCLSTSSCSRRTSRSSPILSASCTAAARHRSEPPLSPGRKAPRQNSSLRRRARG
jgi:23S rRNA (uracil1939-C5)-methyltransferase